MIAVRDERPEDRDAVRRVEEAAFGRPDEADIVDALRGELAPGEVRYPPAFGT